jgi:lipid-binding SYLF domain-containing protein
MKALRTLASALLILWAVPALAQQDQQQTVNQALSTIERMKTDQNFQKSFQPDLAKARGVLVVPSLYKGGFLLGAQYGNGVLLGRNADGSWGYPAFYTMTGASFGLQAGAEDVSILFLLMTDRGLQAVLNNQFKFGADLGVTFAVIGAGMGAGTTTDLGADIVAFSLGGIGLYGGVSLEGTMLAPRDAWNSAYYGQNVSSRAIVMDRVAANPHADRLRDFLGQ